MYHVTTGRKVLLPGRITLSPVKHLPLPRNLTSLNIAISKVLRALISKSKEQRPSFTQTVLHLEQSTPAEIYIGRHPICGIFYM